MRRLGWLSSALVAVLLCTALARADRRHRGDSYYYSRVTTTSSTSTTSTTTSTTSSTTSTSTTTSSSTTTTVTDPMVAIVNSADFDFNPVAANCFEDGAGTNPCEDNDFYVLHTDTANSINLDGDGLLTPTWDDSVAAISNLPAALFGNNTHFESQNNDLNYSGNTAWSAWILLAPTDCSDNNWVVDANNGSNGWGIGFFGAGKPEPFVCSASGLCAEARTTNTVLSNGTWASVIITYSGSRNSSNFAVYVDDTTSEAMTSVDNDNGSNTTPTTHLGIGARIGGSLQWGGGKIGRILVSPEVWDSGELSAIDSYACTHYGVGC